MQLIFLSVIVKKIEKNLTVNMQVVVIRGFDSNAISMEETITFSSSVLQEWWSTAGDMNILILFAILVLSSVIVAVMRISFNNSKCRLPPGPKPLPIIGNMHQLKGAMLHHKLGELASIYGRIMHLRVRPKSWVVASSVLTNPKPTN